MFFNKRQNECCQHLSVNTYTCRPLADLSYALPAHRSALQILSYVCPGLIYLYSPDSTKRGEKWPQTQRIHSSSLFPVAHTQPTHFLSQQRNWAPVMQYFQNKDVQPQNLRLSVGGNVPDVLATYGKGNHPGASTQHTRVSLGRCNTPEHLMQYVPQLLMQRIRYVPGLLSCKAAGDTQPFKHRHCGWIGEEGNVRGWKLPGEALCIHRNVYAN